MRIADFSLTTLIYSSRMKNLFRLLIIGVTVAPMGLSAASFTASIESFRSLRNFDSLPSSLDLRVAALAGKDESAGSTHVLLRGLMPLSGAPGTYASAYQAINVNDDGDRDGGTIYLKMPEDNLPEGAVASPVVGIVSRAGSWDDFGPLVPTTTVGGSSGTSSYDADARTIQFSLRRGGVTFTGSAAYSVVDVDTLELAPFALTSGGLTHNFHDAVLYREDQRFYGLLESADLGADYNSLLFAVELADFPDVDGDSIPDISDPDVDGGGSNDANPEYYDDSTVHWIYYFGGGWSLWIADNFNSNWGFLYVGENYNPEAGVSGWAFHLDRGWVYFFDGSVTSHVFVFSIDLGWLVASEGYGAGQYYRYDTDDFETWVP